MKRFFLITLLMAFGFFANAQYTSHWTPATGFENNMNVLGPITLDGTAYATTAIEVGAFVGNECRGSAFLEDMGGDYWVLQTIVGNPGETITFKVYDHDAGEEVVAACQTTVEFETNATIGFVTPFEIAFVSATTYTVTVQANPAAGGTVTGGGVIVENETCTVTATANAHYTFINWTVGSTVVSTNTSYSFVVTEDVTLVANFEAETFDVAVEIQPTTAAGTVTGDGTFEYNQLCTLTATANPGFSFEMWTDEDDEVLSVDETYSFNVTEDANIYAKFSGDLYMISAICDPAAAGEITFTGASEGDNGYYTGDHCTMTATANTGWMFQDWAEDQGSGNFVVLTTETTYEFDVDGTTAMKSYVARFTEVLEYHEITATVNPDGAGTVTGAGTYPLGASCTLTAIPANSGCTFNNWTLNGEEVSTDLSYTFTVTEDAEYVANFTIEIYAISVYADPAEGGTVSGGGGYNYNQMCSLTATPNEGWLFSNWGKNGDTPVSSDNPYSFAVTENAYYVAYFIDGAVVSINIPVGDGDIMVGDEPYTSGDPITVDPNAPLTIYFTPDACSEFQFFMVDGEIYDGVGPDGDGKYALTIPAGTLNDDSEIEVVCAIDTYIVGVSANPSDGGTVSGGGEFDCYNNSCTISAEANEGFVFVGWTLNGGWVSYDDEYTFTVTESGDYVANFVYGVEVSVVIDPEVGGTVTGGGIFAAGEDCTLTFTPTNEHFTFEGWMVDGEIVSFDNPYTFTVTGNIVVEVAMSYDLFIITVAANPTAAGEVDGGGSFIWGESCTLTATENFGYDFVNWTLNGVEVSTDPEYTFTVTEAGDYVANFEDATLYMVLTMANPEEGGTTSGDDIFEAGDIATVSAVANAGYTFVNWTLEGVVVSTDADYTFTVTDDVLLVANFSHDLLYVAVDVTPAEGGYVNGVFPGGYFFYGHECVLEAIPFSGYSFSHWTMDGVYYDNNAITHLTVVAYTEMVAHFTQNGYNISAVTNPYGAGTITGTGNFAYGATCTLNVTPSAGYTFENWTKNGEVVSTTASYTFTVEESGYYVANLTQNTYTITVEADPAEAAYVFVQNAQNGQFVYGQQCTIRVATPNPGYTFLYWMLNNNIVSYDMSYTFTVTGNAHFVAYFEADAYLITTSAVPSQGGTLTGEGIYDYGTSCTLTATPRNGYTFLRWTREGVTVSTDPTYTFTVTAPAHYVAQFTSRAVYISAEIAARGGEGQIFGEGYYEVGEKVTLTAVPAEDYVFVNWTLNGEIVSTEAEYNFIAVEDAHYVANLMYFTDVNENGTINVTVYPNPAVNQVNVLTSEAQYQLDIFTITGALVRTMSNCSNTTSIDVENLPAGTYIIRLTNGNTVETRRFVKD